MFKINEVDSINKEFDLIEKSELLKRQALQMKMELDEAIQKNSSQGQFRALSLECGCVINLDKGKAAYHCNSNRTANQHPDLGAMAAYLRFGGG